jgi:hypothetical protein
MKFKEAYEKVIEKNKEAREDVQVRGESFRIIAFAWNMIAEAISNGGLEDMIVIKNGTAISIDIKNKKSGKKNAKKTLNEGVDGKEEEKAEQ